MNWESVLVYLSRVCDSEVVDCNAIVAFWPPFPRCHKLGPVFEFVALLRRTVVPEL